MGHDEQLFSEMAGFLQEDGPRWLQEIQEGLAARDVWRAKRAAHTLKGLVANFGAERAVAAAAQIEHLAGMQDWAAIIEALPELERAVEELQVELSPFSRSVRSSQE
jgi:HPt (histidine-containing phosphotransfer) domain-containing protein